ncbi:hypothetical protein U9K52_06210 [Chryseobacterium sp. MHB01]|uniref:hypothetical protein n=1 Tax=Chryseobacterium sp. MHB01 TaxID=3109433 RepID=UPI002B000454|nr:hypothetical protein [Chryseobacterium sp. MHB01]MEA1848498.1 hypothetical protein [Chryseobacterium sp. MHB01]
MIKKLINAAFIFLIVSCSDGKTDGTQMVEKAAENIESDFPIKRLRNTQDILDGIYTEYIKNNKDMQSLDSKIADIQNDKHQIMKIYNDVIVNSENYYEIAEYRAKSIRDSGTKKEILSLLKNSEESYFLKTKRLNELKRKINQNYFEIYTWYDVFKIRKTLGEIEKYQNAHPLETDSLENFIRKQNDIINKLKTLK